MTKKPSQSALAASASFLQLPTRSRAAPAKPRGRDGVCPPLPRTEGAGASSSHGRRRFVLARRRRGRSSRDAPTFRPSSALQRTASDVAPRHESEPPSVELAAMAAASAPAKLTRGGQADSLTRPPAGSRMAPARARATPPRSLATPHSRAEELTSPLPFLCLGYVLHERAGGQGSGQSWTSTFCIKSADVIALFVVEDVEVEARWHGRARQRRRSRGS